jgi:replication-associated recombination protein RarA
VCGFLYYKDYLFYGPFGIGKTSLCITMVDHFKLKIYILSFNNIIEDNFNSLISILPI